ncbi:MAG: hypothetical protein RIR97_1956 [Pseudomonadota bacterium]
MLANVKRKMHPNEAHLTFLTHYFEGIISRFGVGKERKVWYRVLFLPVDVEAKLPFDQYPRLRVRGEIAEVPFSGAFMPTGDKRRYIIVSPTVCKNAHVDVGSLVEIRFCVDDQDRVDVPDILAQALARDTDLAAKWDALTPGRRRGLTQPIHAARSSAAQEKQLLLAIERIMDL